MRWYVNVNGQVTGPVEQDVVQGWIRDGSLASNALVAPEGSPRWMSVGEAALAPPSRSMSTAAKVILGVGCLGFVLVVGFAARYAFRAADDAQIRARTTRRLEREKQAEQPAPAATTDATPVNDKNVCDGRPLRSDGKIMLECREAMLAQVKVPSSAEFQGVLSTRPSIVLDNCDQAWPSWVESSNAFGVKLRTNFLCTYHRDSGTYEITILK